MTEQTQKRSSQVNSPGHEGRQEDLRTQQEVEERQIERDGQIEQDRKGAPFDDDKKTGNRSRRQLPGDEENPDRDNDNTTAENISEQENEDLEEDDAENSR